MGSCVQDAVRSAARHKKKRPARRCRTLVVFTVVVIYLLTMNLRIASCPSVVTMRIV